MSDLAGARKPSAPWSPDLASASLAFIHSQLPQCIRHRWLRPIQIIVPQYKQAFSNVTSIVRKILTPTSSPSGPTREVQHQPRFLLHDIFTPYHDIRLCDTTFAVYAFLEETTARPRTKGSVRIRARRSTLHTDRYAYED